MNTRGVLCLGATCPRCGAPRLWPHNHVDGHVICFAGCGHFEAPSALVLALAQQARTKLLDAFVEKRRGGPAA